MRMVLACLRRRIDFYNSRKRVGGAGWQPADRLSIGPSGSSPDTSAPLHEVSAAQLNRVGEFWPVLQQSSINISAATMPSDRNCRSEKPKGTQRRWQVSKSDPRAYPQGAYFKQPESAPRPRNQLE